MSGLGARSRHADELEAAAYLEGTLDPEALLEMEGHLAACEECRHGIMLLRSALDSRDEAPAEVVERARALTGQATPRPSRGEPIPTPERSTGPATIAAPERRPPARWLAAAAGIVLVGAIGVWIASRAAVPGDPAARYRSGARDPLGIVSPPAGAEVLARDLAFAWERVEGADRYVVTILSREGDPIATLEAGSEGPPLQWPADRPAPPSGPIVWKVKAMYLDRVLAESAPVAIEIR